MEYIRDNADVWREIVAKYGLESGDLRSFVGQGHQHADFAFAYGAQAGSVAIKYCDDNQGKLILGGLEKPIDLAYAKIIGVPFGQGNLLCKPRFLEETV